MGNHKQGIAVLLLGSLVLLGFFSLNTSEKTPRNEGNGTPSPAAPFSDMPVDRVFNTPVPEGAETLVSGRQEPFFLSGGLPMRGATASQHMELRLPDGSPMRVGFSEHEVSSTGAVNWTGSIEGDPESFFSLSIVGDAVKGYTLSDRGEFLLTGKRSGELELKEVHLPDGFCETCRAMHDPAAGYGDTFDEVDAEKPVALAAGDPVVDVLVVYTPLALDDAGSLDELLAEANQMINSLNNISSRSGANMTANLMGIAPVSHPAAGATSDGSCSTLWSRLKNPSDGQLDEAHVYREAYGADMVCVFGKTTDYGVASIGGAWSAADYSTAHGVMPHELGHNLGCGHNDVSGSGQTYLQGLYSYSFAHFFNYNGELRGTIMSYVGKRTTNFSNPNKTWNGIVTGTATRDHARTIRTFAPMAAGWKTSNPTDYDNDGIPNAQESASADADGDGLPDMLDPDNGQEETGPQYGMVAHWPLDEGFGTFVTNLANSTYTAEIQNGAAWGSDATRASYVSFDGVDDKISTTFTYALADTNTFTWAWWANKQGVASEKMGSIMVGNRYPERSSTKYGFIKMTPQGAQFANCATAGEINHYNYHDVEIDGWHHYAMVKDGTGYQWYVDGVAQSATNLSYSETAGIPFMIGGDDGGSENEFFQGFIDDVVLYKSALTSYDVDNVMNGIYDLTVTLTTLETPVDYTEPTAWSDGLAAHSGARYVIPSTGNLRSEPGSSSFPGLSLTVEPGGKYQVRATGSDVTTVDELILSGGTGASHALLAAGTGNNAVNTIGGKITNAGRSKLISYGGDINRDLKVLSQIAGGGTLVAGGGATVMLDNSANTFSGTWQTDNGANLHFNNAGAVGTADIEIAGTMGTLRISGNWNSAATLTVADEAAIQIDLGNYGWAVSNLVFGGESVEEGLYSAAELNALGSNPAFIGAGTLRVGVRDPDEPIAHWKLDEASGSTAIDSSGNGHFGSLLHGPTWGSDATRGSYVSFDGNDDRISTAFTYALSSSDDFTWAWWANRQSTGDGDKNAVMVGNRYGGTGAESLEFVKMTPSKGEFFNGTGESYDYADITSAGWHHYAMVKTGNSYQWYVDGLAQGGASNFIYTESSPIPFNIGGDDDDQIAGGREGEHFEGFIDDVVLYDRALTQQDIQGVRNGIYGGEPVEPPGVAYVMSGGDMVFNWIGSGFKVQTRTNLTDGAWEDVPGGDTPPVTNSTSDPEAFFRLIEQ